MALLKPSASPKFVFCDCPLLAPLLHQGQIATLRAATVHKAAPQIEKDFRCALTVPIFQTVKLPMKLAAILASVSLVWSCSTLNMNLSTAAALLVIILSSSSVYADENEDNTQDKQIIDLIIENRNENREVDGPENVGERSFSVKTEFTTHVSDVALLREIIDSEATAAYTPPDTKSPDSSNGRVTHTTYNLSVDGHDLTFYLSKLEDREEFPVTHYFGSLEDGSYVLLSVNRFTDALVGTVSYGSDVYRIVGPGQTDPLDSIYKMSSSSDKLRSASFHGVIDQQQSDPKMYDMERTHLKQAAFVEMGASFAREYTDENVYSVTARGENLGVVDLYTPPEQISESLAMFFSAIEPLSGLTGTETFLVKSIAGGEYAGYTIYFRQVINGVPVKAHNWVEVEAFTGYVKAIHGLFISGEPKNHDVSRFLPEVKAHETIEQSLISELERPENFSFTDFSYKESDLTKYYIVEERGVLKLMYEYEYLHFIVRVDGLSGEVEIVSLEKS